MRLIMSSVNVKLRNVTDSESNEVCMCEGCNKPATHKVSGEEDSFGTEWSYYCEPHALVVHGVATKADDAGTIGTCKWCKRTEVAVFRYRDSDEGHNGPVYNVCDCCIQRDIKQSHEEYEMNFVNQETIDYEDETEEDPTDYDGEPSEITVPSVSYTKATHSFTDEVKRKRDEANKRKSNLQ